MDSYHIPEDEHDLIHWHRIAYLIVAFIEDRLTPAERDELDEWVGANNENLLFFEDATEDKRIKQTRSWFKSLTREEARRRPAAKPRKRDVKPWYRTSYFAVAACFVLVAGIVSMLIVVKRSRVGDSSTWAQATKGTMLILANGNTIYLDSVADGILDGTGDFHFTKSGHELYVGSKSEPEVDAEMNELVIPKGKRFTVVLSDGTRVELNSGSSLRFPYLFHNETRDVELRGEGYFEVTTGWSFTVHTGSTQISVLGTKFNVHAYPDDDQAATMLVEGSVRVTADGSNVDLKPGEQSYYSKGNLQVQRSDINEALAWRRNQFIFRNTSLRNILEQLEHWYNVEIKDKTQKDQTFSGTFDRNWPIEKILDYLEDTQRVQFEVKGKTIIVTD